MTIGFLTNIISPHQIPLARELVKIVGEENYRYIYTEEFHKERAKMGWSEEIEGIRTEKVNETNRKWLEGADLVYLEERDFDLIETRLKAEKKTFYVSERWWKPILIELGHIEICIPGWVKMFVPRYYKMCKKFVRFFESHDFKYLPQGPWAKKDMIAICKWFTGRTYEEKMVDWGYFVAPSVQQGKKLEVRGKSGEVLRVLWVGRMLKLKRVDTIILAVREIVKESLRRRSGNAQTTSSCVSPLASSSLHSKDICSHIAPVELTLVGDGPERKRLEKMAEGLPVKFLPSQPIAKIREIMREHDVYVFASNCFDGWGAVVSEAVEEGMKVLGTYETGAAATILPESNLFHCGDYKALAKKLTGEIPVVPIGDWSAKRAAERMIMLYNT